MNNKDKIIQYIKEKQLATPNDIGEHIQISQPMVHRYLKSLLESKIIEKKGSSPKVYYSLSKHSPTQNKASFPENNWGEIGSDTKEIIEQNFTLLKADGQEFVGVDGFTKWCNERNYKISSKAKEYRETLEKYEHFKKGAVINATEKVASSFPKEKVFLDNLYYLHPYSLPIFGKTKVATWLFHAKQTQNKILMKRVFDIVIPEIQKFIQQEHPDAIAFIPPTVPRKIQVMKELQKSLSTNLPDIKIEKIKMPIMIQQKSLKDIEARVENAENTMALVNTESKYKTVLVVDDFTGSGSTLNVVAGKIKQQRVAKKVIGLTITGSMNGFEVIREI